MSNAGTSMKKFIHNPYKSSTTTFLQLNDDCILHIFSLLPLLDLCSVRNICTRLRSLADYYFVRMHKVLNFGCHNIKSESNWLTQDETKTILQSFGRQIEALVMNADYFSAKPEDVLQTVSDYCDHTTLRELKLIKFSFEDVVVDNCPQLFSNLEKISIDKCFVDDRFFEKLFKKCAALQHIELIRQFNIDGTCLMHSYPTLRGFSLISNDNFDPNRVNTFFVKNPQLQVLKLIGCNFVDDEIFQKIADNLIELRTLAIRLVHVTSNFEENILHLLRLQYLRELEFNCCVQPIEHFVTGLAMNNRIESIGISTAELTAELCSALCNLKNLQVLKLISMYDTKQTRTFRTMADKLPNLTELHVVDCEPINFDEIIEFVEKAQKLNKLVINQCCNIVPFGSEQFLQLAEACQKRYEKVQLNVHLDYEELVTTKQNVSIEMRREYSNIIQLMTLAWEDTDHCVSDAQSRYFAEEGGAFDVDYDEDIHYHEDDDDSDSEFNDPYNVWNDDFDDEDLYPF